MDNGKELPGFMVYRDLLDGTKRLTDEELGRVFRAMMRYAFCGEEPDFADISREATAFDMIKPKLDKDFDKYIGQVSASKANGKKGGRPRKERTAEPAAVPETDPVVVQPVKSSLVPFGDADSMMATQQDHDEIFNAAERAGVKLTQGAMDELVNLYAAHGKASVIDLLNQAAKNQIDKALPYISKILKDPKTSKAQPAADDWRKQYGGNL